MFNFFFNDTNIINQFVEKLLLLFLTGMFDIWPVMDKCTVVAKKELFYAWPFGLAAWLCGLIFIDRMNTDKARTTINRATTLIKEKKVTDL
jgi:lysophosphatidate acyltransferase